MTPKPDDLEQTIARGVHTGMIRFLSSLVICAGAAFITWKILRWLA